MCETPYNIDISGLEDIIQWIYVEWWLALVFQTTAHKASANVFSSYKYSGLKLLNQSIRNFGIEFNVTLGQRNGNDLSFSLLTLFLFWSLWFGAKFKKGKWVKLQWNADKND